MSSTLSLSGRRSLDHSAIELARSQLVASEQFGVLRFRDAARVWLAEHRPHVAASTYANYLHMLAPLTEAFGDTPLNEIDWPLVQEYQRTRQLPWFDERSQRSFRAGYSPINHECSMLGQILARAGLWKEIAKFYKPLKQPKTRAGRALEAEEQARLFAVAWSNPYWKVAYCAALITVNTGAGWGEIRHLHLSDIDLKRVGGDGEPMPTLIIRDGLKNEHRDRTVYLNETAVAVLKVLLERAHKLGATDPEHFLLPHHAYRAGEAADPNRPMRSCKRAFRAMRVAAGLPKVRFHDLRHHFATRLLENPENSEQTVKEIMGHVSKRILNRYSHIRMQPKRTAVEGAETKAAVPQLIFDFDEPIALPRPEKRRPVGVRSSKVAAQEG